MRWSCDCSHDVLASRLSGRPEAACIERHPAVSAPLAQAHLPALPETSASTARSLVNQPFVANAKRARSLPAELPPSLAPPAARAHIIQLCLSLFRQICAGLNSLHSHAPDPIIHTDLKPSNIMLNAKHHFAKIADFGLSKIKTDSYGGTHNAGTMLYNAPEMLLDGVQPHRPTDIYAMGLILWELLAGKPVWHNSDGSPFKPSQLNAKYFRNERPPIDAITSHVNPAVIALMNECWAQNPSERPSADELWRRTSALDLNYSENNKALDLRPSGFVPTCHSLEDCLRSAIPADVCRGLLRDMPIIDAKYRDRSTLQFIQQHGLSEVEAKCIIMFTHESLYVPNHPRPLDPLRPKRDNQLYFIYNKACRERDAAALQKFQNFSHHFNQALNKLPNTRLPAGLGASLYRGFGERLEDMNDLYSVGREVWWYYTSSSTRHLEVAHKDFARGSGTLMELTGIMNAKDIQPLSMIPTEGELVILHNTRFKVKVALSCAQARLLNARFAQIPDNVDLVILEAQ